jgi:hypothetical protein
LGQSYCSDELMTSFKIVAVCQKKAALASSTHPDSSYIPSKPGPLPHHTFILGDFFLILIALKLKTGKAATTFGTLIP